MSAIAATVGALDGKELVTSALEKCAARGTMRTSLMTREALTLGVARRSWEFSEAFSGPVTVVEEDGLLVAADASLYYTTDLLQALGAERPKGGSPSHRILAAYRKWGVELASHLEGDFAFVLWDSSRSLLVACRDFAGSRPLFFGTGRDETGTHWISLASSAQAVLCDARCSDELDQTMLAATATGVLSDAGPRTCFREVQWLPAGNTLVWHHEQGSTLKRHWSPPSWTAPTLSFEEATSRLRELLFDATRERMSPHGITGVSLSGGWDSPVVFGAARDVARTAGPPMQVVPVSISYPEGDPGREDELIHEIAEHWDAKVHWLHSTDVPILSEPAEAARNRDLPWAHLFEYWNRTMPSAVAAMDARVLLSGYGGDQLFQVSDVYLSDLFWSLRWIQLRREWVAKGGVGLRSFFKWAIEPGLSSWALRTIKTLRGGRELTPYIHRLLPSWLAKDFVGREELVESAKEHEPPRTARSRVEAEAIWYLLEPMFPRVHAAVTSFALEADVEHRAPLYDRRIVEFVATRPWSDRSLGKETKRLLRAASKGLVPDSILAPRTSRTGTTGKFTKDAMGRDFPALLEVLREQPLRLAELGIVDAEEFDAACEQLRASPRTGLEHAIFLTAQTELWLRGLVAGQRVSSGARHEQA